MAITVHLVNVDGRRYDIVGTAGANLMRLATDAGVPEIVADCGGMLNCATCHVIVDEAWAAKLPPPSAGELAMLEMTAVARQATSRLSCQITLEAALDGLVARLPSTQF